MRTWWVKLGWWSLLVGSVGCRTMTTDLKPPKQPEVLASPPAEARYDSPLYPKEAYANTYDPTKKSSDSAGGPGMPMRGGAMGGAPGMAAR